MIDMNSCMGLRWFSSKALFLVLVTKACFYGQAQGGVIFDDNGLPLFTFLEIVHEVAVFDFDVGEFALEKAQGTGGQKSAAEGELL